MDQTSSSSSTCSSSSSSSSTGRKKCMMGINGVLIDGYSDQAKSRPLHDAYLAGKSIEPNLENSSRMRSNVSQLEATRIVLDAKTVGKGYPLLNNVSESLLEILGEEK